MWNHSEGHSGKNGPGGGIHRPYPGFNVAPSLLTKSAQLYNYGRLLHPSPRDHGFDAAPRAPGTAQGPEARGLYLVPEGGIKPMSPRDRV